MSNSGQPVYLRDIWPTNAEVKQAVADSVTPEMFVEQYSNVFTGNETWNEIPTSGGELYDWDATSTYIQEPPFFTDLTPDVKPIDNISGARVLVKVGNSITTDHISPAGSISRTSPAAEYLIEKGVEPLDFNSYGSRRGNDRVMTRGTFANIRLRNQMAPGTEGGWTTYLPTNEVMTIYDASVRYIDAEHAAGGSGGQRVWHRQLARLGGQGTVATGHPSRHCRELRANPSQQPGRHGHSAAAVQRRSDRRIAGLRRHRDLRDD